MKDKSSNITSQKNDKLLEDVDYYWENGLMVLTAHFLLRRGYCCENNCRHCPYRLTKEEKLQ